MIKKYPCSAESDSFERIEWAIFGTLTWDDSKHSGHVRYVPRRSPHNESARQKDFKDLFFNVTRRCGIRERNFAYYRNLELGGSDGAHYHFLIAKDGIKEVSKIACILTELWTEKLQPAGSLNHGMGRAKIEPYDYVTHGLSGVQYVLKHERDNTGQVREREQYISDALKRLARKRFQPEQSLEYECL